MKLLATSQQLSAAFAKLMRDYDSYYWAVAWASVGFPAYEYLRTHAKKAKMIVVGTHFYQTHPEFIEVFCEKKPFRFFYDAASIEGTYHPKAFLFEKRSGKRAAIIGSTNFTGAALSTNTEMCLLINDDDEDSLEFLRSLKLQIEHLWRTAAPFPKGELNAYKEKWKRRWPTSTKTSLFRKRTKTNLLDVPLLTVSWDALYNEMRNTRYFSERLKMLQDVRTFFHPMVSFKRLSLEERRKVAGIFRDETQTKWRLFGSMQGAIDFKERVRSNRTEISSALDCIPWESAVTRSHYERFKNEFRKLFVYHGEFNGVAVPSRMLAMKRPDYFLCIDRPNRKELASKLGIPSSRITLDSYWEVIEQFIDTPWWNSAEPVQEEERESWLARVAMLDSLFYHG